MSRPDPSPSLFAVGDNPTNPGGTLPVIVPADVRARFGDLIDLILASESMNDDERRYWIDILPAMNEEQVAKLRDILVRERDQLAAIDAKYANDMSRLADAKAARHLGDERRERQGRRESTEAQAREEEAKAAEELLGKMDDV